MIRLTYVSHLWRLIRYSVNESQPSLGVGQRVGEGGVKIKAE